MTKSLKVLSLVFIIVGTLWLILGLSISEIGLALFVEIFLPVLGGIIGLWIIIYSVLTKHWRFFGLASLTLAIVWIGLWLVFD